ncbi:MAG: DUF1501 domain-containing protein [Planctomycetota bacterium]
MTNEEQQAFLDSPLGRLARIQTRRQFFKASAKSLGGIALASLLNPLGTGQAAAAESSPGSLAGAAFSPRQHIAKAKRVIFLYMAGGPSHLDLFDPKPKLSAMDGTAMPESFTEGQPIAQLQGKALKCMAPQFEFKQHGQSGQTISSALPHISGIADDICLVKSMVTEQINHDPAHTFMNTGTSIAGRPSMGSWVTYGLGSESDNLPGFVVLTSAGGGQGQPISARQWHSGFLPSRFQGVPLRSKGAPVDYIDNPLGVGHECQRSVISSVGELNQMRNEVVDDPEIATRISQYEMAFRMQTSVPDMADIAGEPQSIKDLYGVESLDGSFAANCLLARRLAERGVRFIQLYHRGWDHHGEVKKGVTAASNLVDRASAALVADLKQRGLLDDTLVIWGGEFGRTPMAQGSGRDHHIKGFSMWMAGGGVRPGVSYGQTDDLGYHAVEDVVHVHDFHATMLHLLGIEHTQLTYRYQGRDFRLTDVFGHVLHDILV